MQPTVLVTGSSGFIGTWVVRELLQRSLSVIAFDAGHGGERWQQILGRHAEQVTCVEGDVLHQDAIESALDRYPITHVIHLAAVLTPYCQEEPGQGFEINVSGSVRLLEQIRRREYRIAGFTYASSAAVYGEEPGGDPPTFYGVFKKAVEQIARQYWRHYDIPSVGFRPFIVYGPGRESGQTAAPSLAARALARGEKYAFPYSGSAGYEFVGDLARAFVEVTLAPPKGAFVVDLPGQRASVDELIALYGRLDPRAESLLSVDGPPLPRYAVENAFPIANLLPGWKPTSLEAGFKETLDFYTNQAK